MKRECICEECKRTFTPHPTSLGRFCSNRCRALWQRGERSNRYKGGTTTLTCVQCGGSFEAHPYQIKAGRKLCSRSCQRSYQTAKGSPFWKGGRRIDSYGYVSVYAPDHPRANSTRYIHEHVLVAEAMIGRFLLPDEVVHHKDRNRANNDPSNLQVMTRIEHSRLHRMLKQRTEPD
jgi:hypothetical protein